VARCVGVENAVCTQLGPLGRPGLVARTWRLTYTLSEASVSLSGAGNYRSWLTALLTFPFLGISASVDTQEGPCSYDPNSHSVNIQAPPTESDLVSYVLRAVDGQIFFQGAPCGDANVTNTDSIHFSGLPEEAPVIEEYVHLHLPFAPGFSPEPVGLPEIEILLQFPSGAELNVYGTNAPDSVVRGDLGYNFNGDDDVDVSENGTFGGSALGGTGADFISSAGGRGTGAPAPTEGLYGGRGADRLVDGPYTLTFLDGGRGIDVLRGGAGNDILDSTGAEGRDKLYGGTGRDLCYAVRGKDKTRSCERVLPPPREG
jgi:Ca2+-binding RTX toxin-like protein